VAGNVVLWARHWRCISLGNRLVSRGESMKNRLKVLRAERDWTQGDLAEALKISRQSVNAIETGRYDPSLPLAFQIADLFEMTIEQVFLKDKA